MARRAADDRGGEPVVQRRQVGGHVAAVADACHRDPRRVRDPLGDEPRLDAREQVMGVLAAHVADDGGSAFISAPPIAISFNRKNAGSLQGSDSHAIHNESVKRDRQARAER